MPGPSILDQCHAQHGSHSLHEKPFPGCLVVNAGSVVGIITGDRMGALYQKPFMGGLIASKFKGT